MFDGYSKTRVKTPGCQEMLLSEVLGPLTDDLKPLADKVKAGLGKLITDGVLRHYEIGRLLQTEMSRINAEAGRIVHHRRKRWDDKSRYSWPEEMASGAQQPEKL